MVIILAAGHMRRFVTLKDDIQKLERTFRDLGLSLTDGRVPQSVLSHQPVFDDKLWFPQGSRDHFATATLRGCVNAVLIAAALLYKTPRYSVVKGVRLLKGAEVISHIDVNV